jgi:tRNA(Arg) A34 adenosine deaminase TadA
MPPSLDRDAYMREAAQMAHENVIAGRGGPFGAVVVRDGQIIGRGANLVTSTNDPTAHAEVTAIRDACRHLGTFTLAGCEIYTSCEPCPMCLAAIYWARIEKIFYANTRHDAARIGFDDDYLYREMMLSHDQRSTPILPLASDEAAATFDLWTTKADKVPY